MAGQQVSRLRVRRAVAHVLVLVRAQSGLVQDVRAATRRYGSTCGECADKYGIAAHIRYGRSVERMEWDDTVGRWRITTAAGEVYTARAIVSGIGALHVPSIPEIPGAERFAGAAFHSAQWDDSCNLSGKRVAAIGTGASAIQFIPQIAKRAERVYVFQRTPSWLLPRRTSRSRPRSAPRSAPRHGRCGRSVTGSTGGARARWGPDSRCTPSCLRPCSGWPSVTSSARSATQPCARR